MNEHEEKTVEAFILKEKQDRYKLLLRSTKPETRAKCTDGLNHCHDFDPRYMTRLPGNADIVSLLRREGSPENVHVISDTKSIDGKMMSLGDAIVEAEAGGWGTVISCIPGRLAYYHGEGGESRVVLKR
jgi:hypothetical protein